MTAYSSKSLLIVAIIATTLSSWAATNTLTKAPQKSAKQTQSEDGKLLQVESIVLENARLKTIQRKEAADKLAKDQTTAIVKMREAELKEQQALQKEVLESGKAPIKKPLVKKINQATRTTADKMSFNYQEGVATLIDNVVVTDPRFTLNADKAFVFFDKDTSTLAQLVVLGNVTVVSEARTAICDKAVYTKKDATLVLVGHASLSNMDDKGQHSTVKGDKITIWTEEQRVEVYPRPTLTIPVDASKKSDVKSLL